MALPLPEPDSQTPLGREVGSGTAQEPGGMTPAEVEAALGTNYDRLRALICTYLARNTHLRPEQLTNSPTALTNDLCMVLLNQKQPFRDAEHLMAIASIHCMRLVVDCLRLRSRAKRGAGNRGASLPRDLADDGPAPASWLMRDGVNEALTRLAEDFPRQAQVVTMRAYFERTTPEIAEMLGIGTATVERELKKAKAYLRAMMLE